MPDFTRAETSHTTTEFTAYVTFLKPRSRRHTVTLPREAGGTPRKVVRTPIRAAAESRLRLAGVPSPARTVRSGVPALETHAVHPTGGGETMRARVQKVRAIRARQRTGSSPAVDAGASDVAPADETTGLTPAEQAEQPDTTQIEVPEEPDGSDPEQAPGEPVSEDPMTHELLPPEQQVQEPDTEPAPRVRTGP